MTNQIGWSLALILVLVALTGCLGFFDDTERETEGDLRYNNVKFLGNVTGKGDFSMEGTIFQSAFNEKHSNFGNVSIRLYRAGGTLIHSKCYGTIQNNGTSINVSLSHSELPKYVIVTSPDFWEADRVFDSSMNYYYRHENGEYYGGGRVYNQSDYPVDVTQHSPCANSA